MAEPAWLVGGNTPHVSDSKWFVWARILGQAWDLWSTDVSLKPKRSDTVWDLKEKVLKVLAGASSAEGELVFVGSNLTLTNTQIAALGGTVNQSIQTWKEVHGHDCLSLLSLQVQSNLLTDLVLTGMTSLLGLTCQSNQLTELDVSGLPALTSLQCQNNQIATLDVSQNTALVTCYCANNLLTVLDVAANTALANLDCSANFISALDVSTNTALETLNAYNTLIPSIDITNNTLLLNIDLGGNPMNSAAVDDLLIKAESFGLSNGSIHLFATAPPTVASAAAVAALTLRGYDLQLDP